MAYTDLTNEFETRHLIEWASFDELAENDKDNLFASGTKALFVQSAAPVGWTKAVVNAKAFRIVSGVTGGSTGGGSYDPGASISVSHTHTVASHTHVIGAHSHQEFYVTTVGGFYGAVEVNFVSSPDTDGASPTGTGGSGPASRRKHKNITQTDGNVASGSNTDTTGASSASAPTLKYFDAIICTKD